MKRLAVAGVVLFAVALSLSAITVGLFVLLLCGGRWSCKRPPPPPPLPVSDPAVVVISPKKECCCNPLRQLLQLLLCSCRRTRVEPASANSAAQSPVAAPEEQQAFPEEDVATWRERWFGGPASRALYTIEEESSSTAPDDGESEGDGDGGSREPETPFYTPPVSPPRLGPPVDGAELASD